MPGLFAAGECAAGLHGANRLGGNSLSDLLVFGKRAGEYAARFARDPGAAAVDQRQVDDAVRRALEPFERGATAGGSGPYQVQQDLQEMMQDLVGIVRTEDEMEQALEGIARLRERAARVGVTGNREYNPGWHTALDLDNLLVRVRGDHARRDRAAGEPRRALPRRLSGQGPGVCARSTSSSGKARTAECSSSGPPIPEMPAELKQIIEEQT